MRTRSLLASALRSLLLAPLLLISCTAKEAATPDLTFDQRLQNPLFAERYWDELTDRMANLRIQNDPSMKDERTAAIADRTREDAAALSTLARQKRLEGLFGLFVTVKEQTDGFALLHEGTLYLSSEFATYPGPSLTLFLIPEIDPRDVQDFPNEHSVSLGLLQSPYGAQTYLLPEAHRNNPLLRTVVLWDAKLNRMYGFAQLAR